MKSSSHAARERVWELTSRWLYIRVVARLTDPVSERVSDLLEASQ